MVRLGRFVLIFVIGVSVIFKSRSFYLESRFVRRFSGRRGVRGVFCIGVGCRFGSRICCRRF